MAKVPHDLDLSLNLSLIPQKSHFRLKLLKYPTSRDKSLDVASLIRNERLRNAARHEGRKSISSQNVSPLDSVL